MIREILQLIGVLSLVIGFLLLIMGLLGVQLVDKSRLADPLVGGIILMLAGIAVFALGKVVA